MSKDTKDAQRVNALAGIIKQGNAPKEVPSPAPPPRAANDAAPAVSRPVVEPKAKPLAKSADPDFKHYGLYLRKLTNRDSRRKLEDTMPEWDMSDLVEHLLQQWLKSS